jgi:cell wall-associated NlpC family hydrolase
MQPRLILLLLSVAFAVAFALLRPLPGRAAAASTGPAKKGAVRKPASVKRHTIRTMHGPLGERVAKFAKHLLGVRYVYGGSSPRSGFDCSGFVRYVYGHFGIGLAHSSFAQYWRGRRVGRWAMKPGDLVFFDGEGHVGIYLGHGRFIHAPHTGTVVKISTMAGWYGARFDGARRLSRA